MMIFNFELTKHVQESREGFGGIGIKYLKLLEERSGFKCASLKEYKSRDAISSDIGEKNIFDQFIDEMSSCTLPGEGIIDPLNKNCTCDFGVGGWSINEFRLGRVDFLPPFAFDTFRVATNRDNTVPEVGVFFLRTFTGAVWATVFGMIVMFTILKFLDKDFAPWTEVERQDGGNNSKSSKIHHFLLKSRIPYRIRYSLQSTCKSFSSNFWADSYL